MVMLKVPWHVESAAAARPVQWRHVPCSGGMSRAAVETLLAGWKWAGVLSTGWKWDGCFLRDGSKPGVLPVCWKWVGGAPSGPEVGWGTSVGQEGQGCFWWTGSGSEVLPVGQKWAGALPSGRKVRGAFGGPELGQGAYGGPEVCGDHFRWVVVASSVSDVHRSASGGKAVGQRHFWPFKPSVSFPCSRDLLSTSINILCHWETFPELPSSFRTTGRPSVKFFQLSGWLETFCQFSVLQRDILSTFHAARRPSV